MSIASHPPIAIVFINGDETQRIESTIEWDLEIFHLSDSDTVNEDVDHARFHASHGDVIAIETPLSLAEITESLHDAGFLVCVRDCDYVDE